MSMSLVGGIVVSLVNPIFFARFAPLLDPLLPVRLVALRPLPGALSFCGLLTALSSLAAI